MNDLALRVENLSKLYHIGQRERYETLRDTLTDFVSAPFRRIRTMSQQSNGKSKGRDDTIWALRDIAFEVMYGEVLGIIGRNGAGKSTLLKLLSRITLPTVGRAEIYGRVGSLLEVGTGFHPELTGRENIYLNGAILGMKRSEIERKFDAIVDFAEVEKFLDMPVKRYSSGMYVRLAFAVAAHLDTEILLMDEVLAVGDVAFQKKCLGKMGSVVKEGRTVLFVSHNMAAIQDLCSRTIWLQDGKIVDDGPSDRVVLNYLKTSSSTLTEQVWNDLTTSPGNEIIRLRRVCIRPKNGSPIDSITMRTPCIIEFEFWNLVQGNYLDLSFLLTTEQGTVAFVSYPIQDPLWENPFPVGLFRSRCYVPGDLLNSGLHTITLRFVKNSRHLVYQHSNALIFEVLDSLERRRGWYGKITGAVRPALEWTTEQVDSKQIDRLNEMEL